MSKPVGPYSPIVRAGDWLIVSGQLGIVDGKLVEGGVKQQMSAAIENLKALLESQSASLKDVVKNTVFLCDMADFAEMNEAYIAGFGDHKPARSSIGVAALPFGAAVEIESWAFVGKPGSNEAD